MSKKGVTFVVVVVLFAGVAGAIAFLGPDRPAKPGPPSGRESPPPASPSVTGTAAPAETSQPTESVTGSPDGRNYRVWSGPDQAVASWKSARCGDVVQFGAQLYTQGGKVNDVPEGVEYLGYSLDNQQLWGDRGAARTLYVTTSAGKSFVEWLSTDENC